MSDKAVIPGRYGCGCNGGRHAGDDTDQGRRTLRLKSLSPAQPSHRPTFTSNLDVQGFSAPNERKRAGVNWCNLEGEKRRRVGGLSVCFGRANVRYAVHRRLISDIARLPRCANSGHGIKLPS